MAKLDKLISDIRIEIADREQEIWESDEIIRAIEKCVSLMSRFIPRRAIVEDTIIRSITGETLTIASSTGTLAYKPISVGSVSITGKTLDTDYRIDYLTGVVTEIGSKLPDGDYTVSYILDSYMIDISTLLPDYIKVERVEYPVGETPLSLITFDIFGDILVLRQGGTALSDDNHIRLVYLCKWTPPTSEDDGNYPSHLDDVIAIGSAGQALIFKAEDYVNSSVLTVDNIVTLLSGLSSINLSLPSLTAPTPPSFTFPDPPSSPTLSDVTAPTAPTLDSVTVPEDYSFNKPSAPSLPSAPSAPSAPTLSFTDAESAMDAVADEITAAKGKLSSGETYINTGTRGENVAANYGDYGDVVMAGAGHRVNEALARLRQIDEELSKYASQVTSYGSAVNAYANEISGIIGKYREQINAEISGVNDFSARINKYQQQLANQALKVDKYGRAVTGYEAAIAEENMKIAKYAQDINKYQAELQELDLDLRLYLGKVSSYQTDVSNSQRVIEAYAAQVNEVIAHATQLNSQVSNYLNIAGRYLASGQAKINEMLVALGIKPEFASQKASSEQRA